MTSQIFEALGVHCSIFIPITTWYELEVMIIRNSLLESLRLSIWSTAKSSKTILCSHCFEVPQVWEIHFKDWKSVLELVFNTAPHLFGNSVPYTSQNFLSFNFFALLPLLSVLCATLVPNKIRSAGIKSKEVQHVYGGFYNAMSTHADKTYVVLT